MRIYIMHKEIIMLKPEPRVLGKFVGYFSVSNHQILSTVALISQGFGPKLLAKNSFLRCP